MKHFALSLCFFLLCAPAFAQAPAQQPAPAASTAPAASSVVGALAAADAAGGVTAPVSGPGALPPPAGTAAATPGAPAAAGTPAAGTPAADPAAPPSNVPQPESTVAKGEPFLRSFFFLASELLDIDKAARGIKTAGTEGLGGPTDKPIPPVRTIAVTGISYFNDNNWIVWLNGRKLTPWISLKEIQSIKVEPGVVHLKWFDIGANKVLALSMRPHEIYDIVTGVTLPDQAQVKMEGKK